MAWCSAQIEDLRWALRVRGAAAAFARQALHLIERDVGGLGIVKMSTKKAAAKAADFEDDLGVE
jgi:hypothetical protein